jgi:acetoacetate decarboxylase
MILEGWSLPLSPHGRASLVPAPPWHFSGNALGIDYHGDHDAFAAALPTGMEPTADAAASFVFVEWSSASEHDPRTMADPARGQYREAYVVIHASYAGKRAARVPYIWVDSDLSLARGHIQGFPKKLGTIAISRAVVAGRGGPKLEAGHTFAGHVSSLGQRLAHGSVTLIGPAPGGHVPTSMRLPIWHTRHLPDLAGGFPLVHDLARNIITDFACVNPWTGAATLDFSESEHEAHHTLAPVEVLGGFCCSIAFTITGAEVRPA